MFNSKAILSLLLVGVATMAAPVATAAGTASCWPSSSGISANWGPLADLNTDATQFCGSFSNNDAAVKITSGRLWFGWQTAMFVGSFASTDSCLESFNQIISDCYGTDSETPATMGGSITDAGGANLVISFGDQAKLGV